MTYAWIIGGAVVGAPFRYFVQTRVNDWLGLGFPWGTLIVNLSGCLAIGLLLTLAERHELVTDHVRLLLVVGFLGSYTTFSSFSWETFALVRASEVFRAAGYLLLSTFGGLLGVWAGNLIGRNV